MYCLNQRIGILFRQNLAKKSYELRYFFIDDTANMYYIANLPKLQKVIRASKDSKQLKSRLVRLGQKSLNLNNYIFSPPKPYTTEAVLPFCNRTYIEMKQKQSKDAKDQKSSQKTSFMVLGFMDQDTIAIYDEILHLTGKKKKQAIKRKSISQQKKQEQAQQKVFKSYIQCSQSFSMSKQKQIQNQYEGQKIQGKAEGKGKQILLSKGISFNGDFKQGQKHGRGYLVNQNLDTLQCQFLGDQLAGI